MPPAPIVERAAGVYTKRAGPFISSLRFGRGGRSDGASMSLDLSRRWDGPVLRRVRMALLFLVSVGATVGYGAFLGRTYPVKEWLFWKVGMLWGWGLFLSLACVSFGHLVLSRALKVTGLPTLETVVNSAALGVLGFVFGLYLGGAAHLFNPIFAVALPAVMLASGARPLVAFVRERRAEWAALPRAGEREGEARSPIADSLRSALGGLAVAFGVACVVFVYLGIFTPETINFDASWVHVPIAVDYARAGRLIAFPADYARCVPHLKSMVDTWAFLVPGLTLPGKDPQLRWMMLLHLEFFFFLWTLAGVAAAIRWLLEVPGESDSRTPRGAWAALFLSPAIFVYDNNLGGAADHYLAFFVIPFFLAAMRAMDRFDRRYLLLAGAFAGGALLTKYQAVYIIVGVGLPASAKWLILAFKLLLRSWRARRARRASVSPAAAPAPVPVSDLPTWRELWTAALAFAAALAVVSSPHFLKNLVFYRNPVYPFAQDFFKSSSPTVPQASFLFEWLFKDYRWRPHGTLIQNLIEAVKLCYTFSFDPHYSFTKNVPNTGSLFTLTLPLILFLRAPRRLWLGAFAGFGCLFMWAMTFRVDRHLQTIMPLLMATTGAVLVRTWEMGWAARAGLLPLVGLQLVWGGDAMVYSSHSRVKGAIDMIRSGYDGGRDNRFNFRADFREIGKYLPPNARLLMHTYRPNLGIEREVLMDWAGQQGLFSYEPLRSPRDVHAMWRAQGLTHLLHLPSRESPSRQEDVLFHDYLVHYTTIHKRFGGYEIVDIPGEAPPPPSRPYRVLVVGLNGYKDGLYPVEALKTYEGVPKHLLRWAAPEKPLSKDVTVATTLVDDAEAVLLGAKPALDATVKQQIETLFPISVPKGRNFTIRYRKIDTTARVPESPHGSTAPDLVDPHEER